MHGGVWMWKSKGWTRKLREERLKIRRVFAHPYFPCQKSLFLLISREGFIDIQVSKLIIDPCNVLLLFMASIFQRETMLFLQKNKNKGESLPLRKISKSPTRKSVSLWGFIAHHCNQAHRVENAMKHKDSLSPKLAFWTVWISMSESKIIGFFTQVLPRPIVHELRVSIRFSALQRVCEHVYFV